MLGTAGRNAAAIPAVTAVAEIAPTATLIAVGAVDYQPAAGENTGMVVLKVDANREMVKSRCAIILSSHEMMKSNPATRMFAVAMQNGS